MDLKNIFDSLLPTADLAVVIFAFIALGIYNLARTNLRSKVLQRSKSDWWVDLAGLMSQGLLVPLIQASVFQILWRNLLPEFYQSIQVSMTTAFLIHFLLIDYLYYWNHRLLHTEGLWRFHKVHHSARSLDVWVTGRNSLVTPFLIIYVWTQSFFIFLLGDPKPFLLAAAASAALDIWRHSQLNPKGLCAVFLGSFMILPKDHEWHHSSEKFGINFGANLNLWDRWHGTFFRSSQAPQNLGVEIPEGLLRAWLLPRKMP